MEKKIVVTDKNGVRIAEFTNDTSVNSNESKKNVMVAPTVDIVSNGESSLSFQMLVASDKWQQIKNPENLYHCGDRVYTALNEQSYVYEGLRVSVTLVELWYLLKYKFVQAYNVDKKIEAIDTHTVKILPKTDSKFKLTVNGVEYSDTQVRDSRGIIMPRGSAGYALWAILRDSGWSLGVCDVLPEKFNAQKDYGSFNVESDMMSVLENIQFVQELYGGILDWDSKNKVLNLRDETKEGTDFNTWKGFVARYGKNLEEFPQITYDNNLITRLYPLGNGNLNIAKVNGNKNYVDNFSYTTAVYEGYLQNANIYDTNDESGQKMLKFWGEEQVKKYCRPRKSIHYDIADKRATSDGWTEPFDINNVIKAYYQDTETGQEVWEYLRITHLTYNYFLPSSDTVIEVGDKVANDIDLIYQTYKKVENSVPTDYKGNLSGENVYIEIPDEYWDELFGGAYGYASVNTIARIHAEHETKNTHAIADLSAYADDTFATIESFTSFEKETKDEFMQSYTRIDQVSSALEAQVILEANHYEETKDSIKESNSRITLVANNLSAQITLEANHYNETTNKIQQTNASIKVVADDLQSKITASTKAANEYTDGQVSITNTTINQVSTRLQSEIDARATYTYVDDQGKQLSSSISNLRLYVDGDFASATLQSAYRYADNSANTAAAAVRTYADSTFAKASVTANLNNRVSSIEAKVSGQTSFATIKADYINISGQLTTDHLVSSSSTLSGLLTVKGNVVNWLERTIAGTTIRYLGRS